MKIAICQMDIEWLDFMANIKKIRSFIRQASETSAEIIIFPEMSLSGFCMDAERASVSLDGAEIIELLACSKEFSITILIGVAIKKNGEYLNEILVIKKGTIQCQYTKMHLFSYAAENKAYTRGEQPILFLEKGFGFAPYICYDLRFSELFIESSYQVTGAFIVIANWPSVRRDHWITLLKCRAVDTQSFVIGVNRTGLGGGISYSGDSQIFTPTGVSLFKPTNTEQLIIEDLHFEEVTSYRNDFPLLKDRRHSPPNKRTEYTIEETLF